MSGVRQLTYKSHVEAAPELTTPPTTPDSSAPLNVFAHSHCPLWARIHREA
jgi:hypothetical protein